MRRAEKDHLRQNVDGNVREALRVSLDDNLRMIESSVKYLSGKAESVFFDAEHFFDGYREIRSTR